MFKGRLGIWITVILLCIGIPLAVEHVPQWFRTNNVSFACELETNEFSEVILNDKFGHIKLVGNSEQPDIIFSRDNTRHSGYSVHENALYSPMVLYVRSQVHHSDAGFGREDNRSYYRTIDLRTILLAMEEGKSWQDIGISAAVLDGTITLHIPAKHVWYYPEVEELFYLTLNDYKTPTEEEKTALEQRVNALLNRCVEVSSFATEISDTWTDSKKAYIAPEYCYQVYESMGTHDNRWYVPTYFSKTTAVKAHIFVHNTQNAICTEEFLNEIKNDNDFMRASGWRVKDSTFNVADVSGCYAHAPY